MLTRRIIPCLDCRDGQVVKGVRFANLRDIGSPVACAARYQAQGADEIVLLDVSATPRGHAHQVETIRGVRAILSIPLTVGGGIRSAKDVAMLLEAGADKVSVNSAAVNDNRFINEIAEKFGSQCVVLAVDAAMTSNRCWEVLVHSGQKRTGLDALAWCEDGVRRGAGEILLTSWDRDGTRSGYDLELVAEVSSRVRVPVVASGGAASPAHLLEALQAGADAVLAASIFHDDEFTVADVKGYLAMHGVLVRQ